MNIGPWGKDFHKMTERVYKEDLYERTPMLLNRAVELILNGGQPLKGVLNGQGKNQVDGKNRNPYFRTASI